MSTAAPSSLSAPPRKTIGAFFQTFLQKYATPVTAATFVVVGLSGVLLFFRIGEAQLMGVHEWIGLAFIGAAAFHMTRHFRVLSNLLTKTRTRALFVATAMIAAAFILPASFQTNSANPMKQFVGVATNAPVATVAVMVGKTPEQLTAQFARAGLSGVVPTQSLSDIAQAHQQDMRTLFRIVMSEVNKGE